MSFTFPASDPIPLPAPVIVFKLLHGTVLSLHFITMQWLLGWLLIGLLWNFAGRLTGNSTMTESSIKIAKSLPTLMTYVINFGIPPLLFTQVLYGSFLYTSSVLIGAWWISVIFLVILAYSALYAGGERATKSLGWWGYGLIALLIGMAIAKIYTTNMTLMLHPGVWTEMYRNNPTGTSLPPSDPTVMPRWLCMLAGSLTIGGLALVVMGICQKNCAAAKGFMVAQGGWIAILGALLQTVTASQVLHAQPAAVLEQFTKNKFYTFLPTVWIGLAGLVAVLGLIALVRREKATGFLATAALTTGLLFTAILVVCRDGIRDLTLLTVGYDVWGQKVTPNWPIVSIFLAVFVIGVLFIAWLICVALKAKPHTEEVIP